MDSHSFQDIELKIHRYVNDSPAQVVEGVGWRGEGGGGGGGG